MPRIGSLRLPVPSGSDTLFKFVFMFRFRSPFSLFVIEDLYHHSHLLACSRYPARPESTLALEILGWRIDRKTLLPTSERAPRGQRDVSTMAWFRRTESGLCLYKAEIGALCERAPSAHLTRPTRRRGGQYDGRMSKPIVLGEVCDRRIRRKRYMEDTRGSRRCPRYLDHIRYVNHHWLRTAGFIQSSFNILSSADNHGYRCGVLLCQE